MSLYLTYLVSLNFWVTNWLFSCLIFFFFKRGSSIFIIFNFFIILPSIFYHETFKTILLKKNLLISLLAGTITVHPILFYSFILITFLLIYYRKCTNNLLTIQWQYFTVSKFLWLAFILGSLWGVQSLAWGYVWVNDLIEWSLLFVWAYFIFILHKFSISRYVFFYIMVFLLILSFILLIRLNLVQTRHNFLTKLNHTYITYLFYHFFIYYFFFQFWFVFFFFNQLKLCFTIYVAFFSYFFTFLPLILFFKAVALYVYCVFFFNNLLYVFLRKKTLHILLSQLFTAWGLLFSFFFLSYSNTTIDDSFCVYFFYKIIVLENFFFLQKAGTVIVEFINFYLSIFTSKINMISQGSTQCIIFNNFVGIFLFIIFFL